MSESQLIADCQRESPSAQQQLYEQYLPYVVGTCRRFNIWSTELKDEIQEIFIEVFLSIKKYDADKGAFKYWLKRVAIHKILNILRKKRMEFTELDNLAACDTPRTQIELGKLNAAYLTRLIAELPDGYRTVFNLSVIDGYSHQEIGKLLGITAATSRSQLARARQLLQTKIEQLRRHGIS